MMREDKLDAIFRAFFDKDVGHDTNIFDLGANSLTAIQLVREVNSTYGTNIDMERFFLAPCKQTLLDQLGESHPHSLV